MSADVIRAFMVSLGFEVNKQSEQAFNDSLKRTAENAAKLGLAIEAAAAAVTTAVVKMAQGMEKTYYASRRLGSSVRDINAMEHAISQVGGSVDGARSSMEALARFTRNTPGGKNYLKNMLGDGTDVNNTVAVMGALSKKLSKLSYPQALVRAQFLGIDEDTLQAMLRDGGRYFEEYQRLIKKAGVDQDKYAKNSQELMVKVRDLGASFSVLATKVGEALISRAGPYVERFKAWVDKNFDSITNVIVKVTDVVIKLSERLHQLVNDLIDWYDKLDPQAKSLVKTIGMITAALYLMNRGFLATPLGRVAALGAALVMLYDDYKKWRDTGEKGIIDWEKWEPAINATIEALKSIGNWISKLVGNEDGSIMSLRTAFELFAAYMATKWLASFISTIGKAVGATNLLVSGVQLAVMGSVAAGVSTAHALKTGAYAVDPNTGALVPVAGAGQYQEPHVDPKGGGWGKLGVWWKNRPGWLGGSGGGGANQALRTRARTGNTGRALTPEQKQEMAGAIRATAQELGVAPEDIATAMSYETGGTMNPWQKGPTTKWGEHRGLIQWGAPQRQKYGVTENSTITEQVQAAGRYLKDAGVRPGMGLLDIYSAINAGRVGRYNASDAAAGGAPGTVADKVNNQMGGHKNALASLEASANLASLVKRAASLPNLPAIQPANAPYLFGQGQPLLPSSTTNNSTSNLSMKTEININGNADANQIGTAIEAAGNRLSQRNMQTAIR